MKKCFVVLIVLVVCALILKSCVFTSEPKLSSYCWLADLKESCRYDKVKKVYNLKKDEFVNIYLVFSCDHINSATCSFNGGEFKDVTPKSCDDRFTLYQLSPSIKVGENTFKIRIEGKEINYSIQVNQID